MKRFIMTALAFGSLALGAALTLPNVEINVVEPSAEAGCDDTQGGGGNCW